MGQRLDRSVDDVDHRIVHEAERAAIGFVQADVEGADLVGGPGAQPARRGRPFASRAG